MRAKSRERLNALGLLDRAPDLARLAAINDRYFGTGTPFKKEPHRRGVSVFVYVTRELREEVQRQAAIEGITVSSFIRKALRNATAI